MEFVVSCVINGKRSTIIRPIVASTREEAIKLFRILPSVNGNGTDYVADELLKNEWLTPTTKGTVQVFSNGKVVAEYRKVGR